ncbi:pentapeptide repeat-containing protein [Kineosporia sp. J2-2]|uniref:Pentapeptide repeat-containing protein n=1 Tax=Kineosporia corallincola TaxID=2835133 RepID=A0ABS5TPX5_9ACTN|nr:pentapeptide repeat-containing protein [Kineosporia corallincola]MBT0772241.1 pentapeptide repeat-containing protein [Kineosporia corallincola]
MKPRGRSGAQGPRIGEIRLPGLESGDPADLTREARIDGLAFEGVECGQLDLTGSVVMECSLTDVGADEADLRSAKLRDSLLTRVRFPSLRAGRGDWRDVRVEGARIGSAEMYDIGWNSVHFVDCKLTYLNLRGATLRDVAFTRCSIEELDLAGASAQNVAFSGSTVQSLDVQRAELGAFDLRGAELHRLTGLDRLGGTVVSSAQLYQLAPLLAAGLGMTVDDSAPPEIR